MSVKDLAGKVAWVTGGGRGMGRAIALMLSARGASVLVTGRNEKSVAEVVGECAHGGGKARHLRADVKSIADCRAAVALAISTFGGLDIVVANAGISGASPLGREGNDGDDDLAHARDILDTNLMGAYYTFHAALPKMRDGGRLIAISSVLGKFGVPGYAAYCASKAGILGLVRATAHESAARKITCNAIVPGWVDTDMAEHGIEGIANATGTTKKEAKAAELAKFPLGRFIQPEEVADFVAFIAGEKSAAITGQSLSICGGATAFGS